ncbi:MAG: GNAT family N-acetyltransferase [Bauldia sp.]|nr:GNAT family N-acetyltransferase [Bauldia sp.]
MAEAAPSLAPADTVHRHGAAARAGLDMPIADIALSVHTDLRGAETDWRALEAVAPRAIYQRFDWLDAWYGTQGRALGIEPAIVIGRIGARPVIALPFGRRRSRLGRKLVWLGGTHVNSAMGLFDPGLAAALDRDAVRHLFRRATAAIGGFDYAVLCSQPYSWAGHANPLRHLPGLVEDQPVLVISLEGGFDAVLNRHSGARKRKKLRWQENTLRPAGGYRYRKAATPGEALSFLDTFLAQKTAQFARSGVDNVFAEPGAVDFLRQLVARSFALGEPLIELYGLEIEGKVRATFAGGVEGGRFQGYFSAIALDDWQRVSPGDLLLHHLVRSCCERGCDVLDFGIGEERYKASWDALPQRQFATYAGRTLKGRAIVAALRGIQAARVRIRSNRTAWAAVKKIRRGMARLRGGEPE